MRSVTPSVKHTASSSSSTPLSKRKKLEEDSLDTAVQFSMKSEKSRAEASESEHEDVEDAELEGGEEEDEEDEEDEEFDFLAGELDLG